MVMWGVDNDNGDEEDDDEVWILWFVLEKHSPEAHSVTESPFFVFGVFTVFVFGIFFSKKI